MKLVALLLVLLFVPGIHSLASPSNVTDDFHGIDFKNRFVVLESSETCSPYLSEKVIVESSWLTTTEDSLVRQGSTRVCEIVVVSVGP